MTFAVVTHNVADDNGGHIKTLAHTLQTAAAGASIVMWQEVDYDAFGYKDALNHALPTLAHFYPLRPEVYYDTPISYDPKVWEFIRGDGYKVQNGHAGITPDRFFTWVLLKNRSNGAQVIAASCHYILVLDWNQHPDLVAEWNHCRDLVEGHIKDLQANYGCPVVFGCDDNRTDTNPTRFGHTTKTGLDSLTFIDGHDMAWALGPVSYRTTESDHRALVQEVSLTRKAHPIPMIDGNDESQWQSTVTPAAFHMDKAGQGLNVDPTFASKVQTGLSQGALVGAYWMIDTSASMLAQARKFVEVCGGASARPKACDYELAGVTEADKDEFVRTMIGLDPHNQNGTYESLSVYNRGDKYYGDFLWPAAYEGVKGFCLPNALIDQWTDRPEDQDIARFNSMADMWAWARAKEATPIPPRPDEILQAERNFVLRIKETTAADPDGRDARIAYNVLRGVKNTSIPVPNPHPSQHTLNADGFLRPFIEKTPASDVWGHRARVAYNATRGIH